MPSNPVASSDPAPALRRELGLFGAVMMGLGSIVGTGVFVSIGVGAGVAGPSVILAIAIAAGVAACNALSSAQLAASHPVSGGTYEYGYRYLRPWMGFAAGWMFLCAKSASAATAAIGFAGYLAAALGAGPGAVRPVAVGVVGAVTGVLLCGVRRSSAVNGVIVSVALGALALFVLACVPAVARGGGGRFDPFFAGPDPAAGLLHASALMFVAFTGYGRIATMGEEVRDPRRTIPRAIVATLVVAALLYLAVAIAAVGVSGAGALASAAESTAAPLEAAARASGVRGLDRVVAVGACAAMLGVLLNLVLGLSRVVLAMGRRGDLPVSVARVSRRSTPAVATVCVGVAVGALGAVGSVKAAWSFSAFTVLVYYAITNLAALRLPAADRRYPRVVAWAGLAACLTLAFWVEPAVWLTGLGVLGAGLLWHAARRGRVS